MHGKIKYKNGKKILTFRSYKCHVGSYKENNSQTNALLPIASKFGSTKDIDRFSQSHTEFHAI